MRLLSDDPDVTVPYMDARYKYVFPYAHTVGTTQEACSFITFEITSPMAFSAAVKELELYVYVFSAKELMQVSRAEMTRLGLPQAGVRIDLMAARIDEMLNQYTDTPFGEITFKSVDSITPAPGFFGREIRYTITNFNRFNGILPGETIDYDE